MQKYISVGYQLVGDVSCSKKYTEIPVSENIQLSRDNVRSLTAKHFGVELDEVYTMGHTIRYINTLPNLTPCTIFVIPNDNIGSMVVTYQGKVDSFGLTDWAQYNRLPFVNFIPKKKRDLHKVISRPVAPFLVIVEGVNHKTLPSIDMYNPKLPGNILTKSKHSMYSDNWLKEFEPVMDNWIKTVNANVIFDSRQYKE